MTRPRDHAKGLAILDAGWLLFLERGVKATPIEAIAARAGVSKVTLYSHFPDKVALFEAAVLREMERIEAAQAGGMALGGTIEGQLQGFGLGLMRFLASKPAVDFYNVIAGELRRHPKLAQAFFDLGPGRSRANLARLIEVGMGGGMLCPGDPLQAAETLFGLWQGFSNYQRALNIDLAALDAELESRVSRGVEAFMTLYRPSPVKPHAPPRRRSPRSTP